MVAFLLYVIPIGFFRGMGMVFGVGAMVLNAFVGTVWLAMLSESWEGGNGILVSWNGLLWMIWLLGMISCLDVLYGLWYGWSDGSMKRLLVLLLFFTLGMLVILLSGDLMVLFFGWEMIGVASFLLIGYYGGTREESGSASIKALLYNVLGDVGVLFTLVMAMSWLGSSHLGLLGMDGMTWCGFGVLLGGWCKSALFGMHGWLLDAMEGPTPVSALLHSATLVTAGALCLWKLSGIWFGHRGLVWFLLLLASISILYASLHALWLLDLKRVVASSTCLHLAVSFLGMAGGSMVLVLEYLLHHGVIKALLFFMVGMGIHACSSQDSRGFLVSSGLVTLWSLSLLTVTGVVGSGLGLGKDLLLMNGFLLGSLLGVFLFLLAQLYSALLLTSLDLSVSSTISSSSMGMFSVFVALLSFSGALGVWESSLVVEWMDLGFAPYVVLLFFALALSSSVVLPRLVLLGAAWFQRSFVEVLGSSVVSRGLPFFPSTLHHGFVVFPLSAWSARSPFPCLGRSSDLPFGGLELSFRVRFPCSGRIGTIPRSRTWRERSERRSERRRKGRKGRKGEVGRLEWERGKVERWKESSWKVERLGSGRKERKCGMGRRRKVLRGNGIGRGRHGNGEAGKDWEVGTRWL